ncbi:enoyl-CoA hydratase/isomerase family protein [Haloferacaceae archaeon DSL9]
MSADGTDDHAAEGPVAVERDDGIARIVLDQPERRNALSVAMANGIIDAVAELEGTDTRCVVLEGRGPAFCAGGDIGLMRERHEAAQPLDDSVRHIIRNTGRAIQRVAECEFPTVAKIHGPAFGAGANLAIACDVQLASDEAKLGFGFRQVGLAVDSGTSYLLPKLVGDNVARELVFTGELLDAERARSLGLLNRVYPASSFDDDAEELIRRIAAGPTVALRTSKRLLRRNAGTSLAAAIEQEAGAQAAVFASRDHSEGVQAFLEKRDPNFTGT